MKKLKLLFLLLALPFLVSAQAYNLNYTPINAGLNTSSVFNIKGFLRVYGTTSGVGGTDSVLVISGARVYKIPANYYAASSGSVTSVSGTTNRITSTGGATPVIDISTSYVGQATITTLGTISTGVWNGTVLTGQYGGTGVANTGKTITLGGNLTTSGANAVTFTTTGTTNITLPTSGTVFSNAGDIDLGVHDLYANSIAIAGSYTGSAGGFQNTNSAGSGMFIQGGTTQATSSGTKYNLSLTSYAGGAIAKFYSDAIVFSVPLTANVTGTITGNASTATALATARNINGASFNGTADITVTAAAGTLTGATLASGVTASSLTSVGTLTSLTVSGNIFAGGSTSNGHISLSAANATTPYLDLTNAAGTSYWRYRSTMGASGQQGDLVIEDIAAGTSPFTITKTTGALTLSGAITGTKAAMNGGSATGGYYMNYQADASSRAFRVTSEHSVYQDFAIQMESTKGGGSWTNYAYWDASKNLTLYGALTGISATFNSATQANFWDGTQGLKIGAYSGGSGYGALYPSTVTPSASNYVFAASSSAVIINSPGAGTAQINTNGNVALMIASNQEATFSSRVISTNEVYTGGSYNVWKESGVEKFYIGSSSTVAGGGFTGYDIYAAASKGIRVYTNDALALTITTGQLVTFSAGTIPTKGTGSVADANLLGVQSVYSTNSSSDFKLGMYSYVEQTAATSGSIQALEGQALVTHTSGTVVLALATIGNIQVNGSGGTTTWARSVQGGGVITAGTVTNWARFYASAGSGTPTNNYSYYSEAGAGKASILDGLISGGPVRLKGYTVATLPAGTQGDVAFVTDALAPSFLVTIVGGGSVVTQVLYNGSTWVAQ